MKVVVFAVGASLVGLSLSLAQEQQTSPPPAQGPVLSTQIQPSEVEKAKTTAVRPKLQPQIKLNGPVVELARGQNPLAPGTNETNVVTYVPPDDLSIDLITRKPRGIVLFALSF
jgi:hypothetical protein